MNWPGNTEAIQSIEQQMASITGNLKHERRGSKCYT